jgi:hypothetical protein
MPLKPELMIQELAQATGAEIPADLDTPEERWQFLISTVGWVRQSEYDAAQAFSKGYLESGGDPQMMQERPEHQGAQAPDGGPTGMVPTSDLGDVHVDTPAGGPENPSG